MEVEASELPFTPTFLCSSSVAVATRFSSTGASEKIAHGMGYMFNRILQRYNWCIIHTS